MFTSLRFAFVVAAACALAAATPISVESTSPSTPRLELPRAIEGLLRSGLRVVVAPRADTEVVAIRLAIRGGASVEDESGRGAALAAVATLAKFEPAGFGALEKNGVVVEHDAALDRVELSIVAPKADLERALKALATALAQCKFEDADVARGKAVIAKASLDAVTLARKAALDATFTRAEANRGVDVDLAREVSGAAVRKYALAHVRSATAVLAISGDLDPGATFHLAREAFEPWERTRQPAFERVVEPSRTAGPTRAIVESERGRALAILWPILDRDSEETGAIRVVAELLRARHPEAHVALDESLGGAGRLVVSRSFEGDALTAANEFERAALGFAAGLDPATLDLAPAREALALALARDLATAEGVAARMARDGAELEDLRAAEREFAALSRLDAARVVEVARKRLDPSRAVIGLAAPVQRGAVSTVDPIARGKIENGPSYVVDRRSGTGLVSVALRVPSSALPRSLGSIAHNAACGALLAEIAVESGAAGEIELEFDESRCSIAFDASPSRAETALRAIFASFRGEDPSAAVIERARKRAADAIAARRRTVIDAVYEHGLGGGPEFLDRATGGDAPLAKLSALNLAPAMRAVDASLAIVGDFDPSRCLELAGTLPAGPGAFSVGTIDPSAAPPRPSSFTGTTAGKNAILGKCFELEAPPHDESKALAALEENSELLAELRDFGFAPATAPRALHVARRAAYSPAFGAKRWLIVALEVAPSDLESARASFDALLDALAKRGVTKDDLAAAKKAAAKAAFARSRTTRGQARALLDSDTKVPEPDSENATALLRKSLASSSPFVILEPTEPVPGPRPRPCDDLQRGEFDKGPEWVVEHVPGGGSVAVALHLPSALAIPDLSSRALHCGWAAYLTELAIEHGANGPSRVEIDEFGATVGFEFPIDVGQEAVTALLDELRGIEKRELDAATRDSAGDRRAILESRARSRMETLFRNGRAEPIATIVEVASGSRDLLDQEESLGLPAPGQFEFARIEDVRLAIVGEFDASRISDRVASFLGDRFPAGHSALPPSITRPAGIARGTIDGEHAIVARVIDLDAVDVDNSDNTAALDALAGTNLLPELCANEFDAPSSAVSVRAERAIAFTSMRGAIRVLVIAMTVAPREIDVALASLDAMLSALGKRGVLATDIDRHKARAMSECAEIDRERMARAMCLVSEPTKFDFDAESVTAVLRRRLVGNQTTVVLEPSGATTVVAHAGVEDLTSSPKTPEEMTIPELEAKFGKNLLEPDPAAAGRSGAPTPAQEIDVLRRWYGDPPGSLNMAVAGGDSNVVDSLCEYVAFGFGQRHDKDPGKWAPGVADYASWSDDHRVVTVRIRGDVTWQFPAVDRADPKYGWLVKRFAKGAPKLTAHDVAFTYRVFMDPGAAAGGLRGAYAGSSLRLLDDRTYQVTWEAPTTMSFVYSLNLQTVLPEFLFGRDESGVEFPAELLGKGVLEHWYNNRMCGYGPYEFVRMEPNERIVLKRKDDFPVYRPAVKELHWEILKDPEQVVQRMLQGSLDAITLQPQQYKQYWLDAKDGEGVRRKDLRAIPYLRAEYFFIGWNTRRPQLADPIVRRALAHAVNRAAIIDRAFLGAAELVDGPFRREHPHRLELESPAFDTDEAGALLESAGWKDADNNGVLEKHIDGKDVEFRITFTSFAGSAEGDMIAAVLKSDFEKLGIVLDVITLPWPQMREAVFRQHDYDCYLGVWGTAYEVDLRAMFHSRNAIDGLNYGGYSNPRIDAIADEYVHEFEPANRRALAHEFQRVMRDDPPYAFLLRRERMTVVRDWLDGVEYSPYRPQLLSLSWRKKSE